MASAGGNLYVDCEGVGQEVAEVTMPSDAIGPGRLGANGEGVCAVCGRVVSQRGGIASRHADKRVSR